MRGYVILNSNMTTKDGGELVSINKEYNGNFSIVENLVSLYGYWYSSDSTDAVFIADTLDGNVTDNVIGNFEIKISNKIKLLKRVNVHEELHKYIRNNIDAVLNHPDWMVRYIAAELGYGQDKFLSDPDNYIKNVAAANKMCPKYGQGSIYVVQ